MNCVGDLHVERFGTWRDLESRLVWGIHDLDQAYSLPYTNDLVRLTASARLANREGKLSISDSDACDAILTGYRNAFVLGGCPLVLTEHNHKLRQMVEHARDPANFWDTLDRLPTFSQAIPERATAMIELLMPEPGLPYRIVHRLGGLGSLGLQRFVALASWQGERIGIEVEEIGPPAQLWASPDVETAATVYEEILWSAVRVRDPWLRPEGGWVRPQWFVRRLGADRGRIDLASLRKNRDERKLLEAMGKETANVHLGTRAEALFPWLSARLRLEARIATVGTRSAIAAVTEDLARRDSGWLERAADAMVQCVEEDWQEWKQV